MHVFTVFQGKKHKMLPKAPKCLILSHFTTLAKHICNCRIFPANLNFSENQRRRPSWRPSWMTSRTPVGIQPIIFTLSCRVHHRLFIKGKIFSKYCNAPKTKGLVPSTPPCTTVGVWISLYVRGLILDRIACCRFVLKIT